MKKKLDFKSFKEEALQDPEVRAEYELLRPEFELIIKLIKARQKSNYSQTELAERLQLQQPAVARLENGGYANTSISKLSKVADALGYQIKFSLSPKKEAASKTQKKSIKKRAKPKKVL